MEVRNGWNTEFGRTKFDVTCDEGDLARILAEAGLPPERAGELTTAEVYKLLTMETDRFAETQRAMIPGVSADDFKASAERMHLLNEERDKTLAAVRARLGMDGGSSDY